MHPLDCVRLKRTITWPGAPHRSVLLSGPASSAERRRRHKQMLWKALWNGRELVRTLPEPCRTVPCRADCHNSVHSPARPLAFLNLKGQRTSSGEEGGCRGSAGARWFHDISDKGGEKWDLAPCHIDGSRRSVEFTFAFTALCR